MGPSYPEPSVPFVFSPEPTGFSIPKDSFALDRVYLANWFATALRKSTMRKLSNSWSNGWLCIFVIQINYKIKLKLLYNERLLLLKIYISKVHEFMCYKFNLIVSEKVNCKLIMLIFVN